ncbi:YfhO family protein [Chryseobacterium sp. KACC 21268]|nr:YfhO family protein [Chryseobacterium sp. KACC 21268]
MKFKNFLFFSIILITLEVFVFREFVFGDLYFIFKDLGSDSYVNDYTLLYNRLLAVRDGLFLPGWSFRNGLGENLYPYSFEPFSWLLFRLTDASVEKVMLILPILYIYLAGVTMYLFLSEYRLIFCAKVMASSLWAFSGYYILSCSWSVTLFSPVAFHFSFLLFALQRAFFCDQYYWIAIVFALIGISYPVNLFFALIFSIAYFSILFYITLHKKSRFAKPVLFSAISTLIGIGMSCWMSLSSLYLMKNSPRGSGEVAGLEKEPLIFAGRNELIAIIYRLFSPNILGDVNHFSLYRNYFEAPLLYCGIFNLLLLSQISVLGKKGKRVAAIAIILMLSIYLSPLIRSIFWFRSGDYYRILNIFFAMVLCIISGFILSGIIQKKIVFVKPLLLVSIFFISILIIGKIYFNANVTVPILFVTSYSIILLISKKLIFKGVWAIIPVVLVEITMSASQIISERNICNNADIEKKGYMDASSRSIQQINQSDKTFFRLEKDFYSGVSWLASYNEAKIQGYNSSAVYNSFNNKNYIDFLRLFDIVKPNDEPQTRFVPGIKDFPFLMKLCSVKYFLASKPESEKLLNHGFRETDDKGNFKILTAQNPLPLGFCYDKILSVTDFQKLSDKDELSLQYLVAEDADIKNFKIDQTPASDISKDISAEIRDTLKINSFSDHKISGTIHTKGKRFLFFSIPFDEGWNITDNGKRSPMYKGFGGLIFLPLESGSHRIVLDYTPPCKIIGVWISFVSLILLLISIFFTKTDNL